MVAALRGIALSTKKKLTADKPIELLPPPAVVHIAVAQSPFGPPPVLCVKVGDLVRTGQLIGRADHPLSVSLHASISGRVSGLGPIALPGGGSGPGVSIVAQGEQSWGAPGGVIDWRSRSVEELLGLMAQAGLVGMGGAAFPAHVKLTPDPQRPVDTLIVNGCECEPYIATDYRLLIEKSAELLEGIEMLLSISGAKRCFIAIERHTRHALSSLVQRCGTGGRCRVVFVPSRYPQGAEKVLISRCTGRRLKPTMLPRDVGVVVHNVATVYALHRALGCGWPLIERVVTVSGEACPQPRNLVVRIGTPVGTVLGACGVGSLDNSIVLAGGPMMGKIIGSMECGLLKATSAVVVLPKKMLPSATPALPCIRCGSCTAHCPRGQRPAQLAQLIEQNRLEEAQANGLFDCFECGCCAYNCPARRDVVSLVKAAKAQVLAQRTRNAAG
jgi:electron transport complex protein RnfC